MTKAKREKKAEIQRAESTTLELLRTLDPLEIARPDEWADQVHALVETADGFEIKSSEDEARVADFLRDVKRVRAEIETTRKNRLRPFEAITTAVSGIFRGFVSPLDDAEKSLKKKLLDWRAYLDAERRKEEERRAEEYRKRVEEEKKQLKKSERADYVAPPPPAPIVAPVGPVRGTSGTVSLRERWTYEVYDLDKIPREFLVVNSSAIRTKINTLVKNGMNPEGRIPGVRIFKETSVASR